jgi:outer membrane protein
MPKFNQKITPKKTLLAMTIATLFSGIYAPAFAHEAGDWLVRGRLININPSGDTDGVNSNGTLVAGTAVSVEDAWTVDLDISYMLTDHWGVELLLDASSKHDVVGEGAALAPLNTIISSRVLPPSLLLQYHFLPKGNIQPYVGVGVNYTLFFNEKATDSMNAGLGGVSNLKLGSSFGLAAQVGADIILNDDWFMNVDVKYIDIDTEVSFDTGALGHLEGDVSIDPWVIGIGIGTHF